MSKLWAERNMGDGNVIEDQVESSGSLHQVFSDQSGNHFSLGDQLTCIELGNDGLEHFVYDRGKDSLVIVCTKFSVAV